MKPFALIIFGITSNLAQIKLIPALYDMAEKEILPKDITIIGISRQPKTKKAFEKYFYDVLHLENIHHKHPIKKEVFENLCKRLHHLAGDISDEAFYQRLKKALLYQNRIFYLATYPNLYETIFNHLQKNKLNQQQKGWIRLIIEKPIGGDLPSAKKLNKLLHQYFTEDQIYRLDHYLGKETLQNILTFRFGNGIFEPLINKDHIDHIQITAAEDYGIGKRGGYFDSVGMLKDVGQNHQLQMIAFATMDAPEKFSNEEVTRQRIKILKNLAPFPKKIVFGQYAGYQKEEKVAKNSLTDTFYAFKTEINNDRFKGVPIYARAGKKLQQTVTEISIVFKIPTNRLFRHLEKGEEPNVLIYRIQPHEGIVLKMVTKKPGHTLELEPNYMQYCYRQDPNLHLMPDPYEKLLVDAISGNQTFFCDAEEVEAQWAFIDSLDSVRDKPIIYKPGTWGPKGADKLIEADGRFWLEPSMQFCAL